MLVTACWQAGRALLGAATLAVASGVVLAVTFTTAVLAAVVAWWACPYSLWSRQVVLTGYDSCKTTGCIFRASSLCDKTCVSRGFHSVWKMHRSAHRKRAGLLCDFAYAVSGWPSDWMCMGRGRTWRAACLCVCTHVRPCRAFSQPCESTSGRVAFRVRTRAPRTLMVRNLSESVGVLSCWNRLSWYNCTACISPSFLQW